MSRTVTSRAVSGTDGFPDNRSATGSVTPPLNGRCTRRRTLQGETLCFVHDVSDLRGYYRRGPRFSRCVAGFNQGFQGSQWPTRTRNHRG